MTAPPAFQPDRPVDLAQGPDLFGHRDYARALASSVLDTDGDFTFGLFGDWGLGKTTVLQSLQFELADNRGCAFVAFDAWRYQDDPFRREFLRDVSAQLAELGALRDWKSEKELGVLDEDVARVHDKGVNLSWPEGVRAALVLALVAAALVAVGGVVLDISKGAVVSLVALMPLLVFALVRLERVFKVQQETVTRKRLEDPDRFASVFRSLVAHVDRDVLVIGIDNVDRLPAEKAVEVLATVKTFLEPAAEAARTSTLKALLGTKDLPNTKVVFVIAVDDGALRRHLRALAPHSATTKREAGDYADEYLRKFFNASTTLRPLLTGDLSAYIRERLKSIFDRLPQPPPAAGLADRFPPRGGPGQALSEEPRFPSPAEQLDETVEMATVALRRNPRRVLQFVANLKLQLRLLHEREQSRDDQAALLAPPVSGHVAMVAKLVLLEEEWPDAYAALGVDEQRWGRWHAAAQRGETPKDAPPEDWPTLGPFLRTSRRVNSPALRVFLRLKRATHELQVPNYDEFRTWVVSADFFQLDYHLDPREAAEVHRHPDDVPEPPPELTDEEREGAREYAQLLPVVFAEELDAGRIDGALNVVACVLAVAVFFDDEAIRRRVLSNALADARTANKLASLDPVQLADGSRTLDGDERSQVLRVLAESLPADWATREHREAVVDRLANYVAELDETARETVRESLRDKRLVEDFWLYEPLGQADPDLLPPEAGQAALRWVGTLGKQIDARAMLLGDRVRAHRSAVRYQRDAQERIRRGPQEAPFGVLLMVANSQRLEGLESDLLDALRGLLEVAAGNRNAILSVAEYASDLRPSLADATPEKVVEFVRDGLAPNFDDIGDVGERTRLLLVCGELLDVAGDGGQEAGAELIRAIAGTSHSTMLPIFVSRRPSGVPRSLRHGLVQHLTDIREVLRGESKWPTVWDDGQAPLADELGPDSSWGETVAAAFAALDRTILARDAVEDPEAVATAVNEWADADEANWRRLEGLAFQADGPGPDDLRGVRVARVDQLEPEDADAVDPAAYVGRLVLTVLEAHWVADPHHELLDEEHRHEVAFRGRVTLTLERGGDGVVYVTAHGLEWLESEP